MGDQLRDYQGAVVFVDLLGFGALTNGKIKLEESDYVAWLFGTGHPHNHHYFAAQLLVELRALLQELNVQHPITIAQLSDCFFAWSRNTEHVIKFTHAFMQSSIKRGLLCRGGMAYGQIIETEQNHGLGRLILGDAVTKAVALEKYAKGARILTEEDFVTSIYAQNEEFDRKMLGMFEPFENPLDYNVYDEFKWYLVDDIDGICEYGVNSSTDEQKIHYTKKRLMLDTLLIHSPKFGWNERNEHGKIQLSATSKFISESGLLNCKHDFARRGFHQKRSFEQVSRINEFVNDDPSFAITKRKK